MDHDNMLSETENIHFCGAGFSLISTSTLKREKKKKELKKFIKMESCILK